MSRACLVECLQAFIGAITSCEKRQTQDWRQFLGHWQRLIQLRLGMGWIPGGPENYQPALS